MGSSGIRKSNEKSERLKKQRERDEDILREL